MQATMATKDLREALQKVNMINGTLTLPVLATALMKCTNGKATLTNTNLECAITVEVDCKHDEDFSMLINRKSAEKFLYGVNGVVKLTTSKLSNLMERDNLGSFRMIPPARLEDFPPTPKSDNITWHTLDAKWFCQMLGIAIPACATELSRPVLNGIACHDGSIASCDGFQLVAIKHTKLTFGLGENQAIIPATTASIIRRLFGKKGTLEIAWNEGAYLGFIKSDGISVVFQLVQGTFPKWEILIPQQYSCKVSFSAPLLAQRLGMIDRKLLQGGIIRYIFHRVEETKEEICSIRAMAGDDYEYSITLPIKLEGNEGKIAFNHKYVLNAIKPFSMCNLEISGLASPGKFTGDIEGLTVVVMPMFVQW